MTPSQKLRSIADSTGLDGIADAIREVANEIEHNNAPAVPQGWKLVPVEPTEAMSIAGGIAWESSLADDVIGPLEDAWAAMLAATPAPAPAVPQDRIDKAKRAVKDLADEAQANGNSETWVSAQERLILSVIDAATPAPAPAQEAIACGLCQGAGVLSPTQKCICQYGGKEPAQEVQSDPNGWCEYVAGMVFCWLQMQKELPEEDQCVAAIAGIIERRLWAYKPARGVVMPTDKQIIQAMTAEFPTPSLVPMLKGSVICGDFHKALVSAVNVGIAEFCRINGIGQPAQEAGLTEAERVRCLIASGCIGTVKMTYDSGPYEITRTSINASRLIDAIIAALRAKGQS